MLRWLKTFFLFFGSFLLVVVFLTVIDASETVGVVDFAIYTVAFLAVGYQSNYGSPRQIRYDRRKQRWRRKYQRSEG